MGLFFFDKILQNNGWKSGVQIETNEHGIITSYKESANTQEGFYIKDLAIPGFQNAHSHAFQYAMAGLAEVHDPTRSADDFWSWREAMYDLALRVDPDQMEAIATMLYAEMLRHGYTNVAEFHYVHHDKNGKPYGNLAEMGSRMVAAAQKVGIGITLIPIFYQKGGFGQAPNEGQKRFITPNIEQYLNLLEASKEACISYKHANCAIGIHSMRGVEPKDIAEIARSGPQDIPFHIHISEQLKEIDDSLAYLNQRPVEWLLDHVELNERYHLVHATHLTDAECQGIAQSKANVVLCPSTEGNLGDGIFPLRDYQQLGGNWSIGTDSHIGLNPLEELRILDYGQRLITHKRNTFTNTKTGNSGQYAIDMATQTGRKAMNDFNSEFFAVGQKLNASLLKINSPLLDTCSDINLASSILYTADATQQAGTISQGILQPNGLCKDYEQIKVNFNQTIRALNNR